MCPKCFHLIWLHSSRLNRHTKKIKIAAAWTDAESETFKLIELLDNQSVQKELQLEGCKKNSKVFSKLSNKMWTTGYERTLSQCYNKIKKLKGDYRKIKDANKQTGNKKAE